MLNKRIITPDDLDKWINSTTYESIISFITDLQNSVEGKANDEVVSMSPNVNKLMNILDSISNTIDKHPVTKDKDISRFGKVEFKYFYDDIEGYLPNMIQNAFEIDTSSSTEIATYLKESFGNRTRIDYGSGHELNFICCIYCLYKLEIFTKSDFSALIIQIFNKYISIMRHLQKLYWLEPAGSHGVWGLDDYHFLPFVFGASQLATHPHMKPKSIHNHELVEQYYKKYMYLECIQFINSIKTIPNGESKLSLRWHSPMLDDISAAKSWMKIKDGMIKMYKAEVLGKLPIMQHFMFGSLITCPESIPELNDKQEQESVCGHRHEALNTWGDCCGIKIPSGIAASEAMKKQSKTPSHIPFD